MQGAQKQSSGVQLVTEKDIALRMICLFRTKTKSTRNYYIVGCCYHSGLLKYSISKLLDIPGVISCIMPVFYKDK